MRENVRLILFLFSGNTSKDLVSHSVVRVKAVLLSPLQLSPGLRDYQSIHVHVHVTQFCACSTLPCGLATCTEWESAVPCRDCTCGPVFAFT